MYIYIIYIYRGSSRYDTPRVPKYRAMRNVPLPRDILFRVWCNILYDPPYDTHFGPGRASFRNTGIILYITNVKASVLFNATHITHLYYFILFHCKYSH